MTHVKDKFNASKKISISAIWLPWQEGYEHKRKIDEMKSVIVNTNKVEHVLSDTISHITHYLLGSFVSKKALK